MGFQPNSRVTAAAATPQTIAPPRAMRNVSPAATWRGGGLWLATLLCVGAVVKAGVQIAMASHGRGSGGEHGMTLRVSRRGTG